MNTVLFDISKKLISILVICVTSLSGSFNLKEEKINLYNSDYQKTSNVTNNIEKFDTINKYNYQIPYGEEKILIEGQDGISFINSNNKKVIIQEKINKVVEIGMSKIGNYNGIITAYGPDCKTCDGRGYVSCRTPNGSSYSLTTNGIYFNDVDYNQVRIIAADQREFPCGTIIEIKNQNLSEPIIGIVMDTGYSMRKAFDQGLIHIDLAFQTEKNIQFSTNKNTDFKVKRWGW